jgi:hypothetical protein
MSTTSQQPELLGEVVKHEGQIIGTVTEIRPNIANGRRYAFVKPHQDGMPERRIPADELTLFWGKP